MIYTMKQVCELTGMTYQGLKFYCNEGLVPNVKRGENNHRLFDERDVAWIKSLLHLRDCGMGIKEMKEYTRLCLLGRESIPERKNILEARKASILRHMDELMETLRYIDEKQQFYDEVLAGRREYFSNILPCSCIPQS